MFTSLLGLHSLLWSTSIFFIEQVLFTSLLGLHSLLWSTSIFVIEQVYLDYLVFLVYKLTQAYLVISLKVKQLYQSLSLWKWFIVLKIERK